MLINSSLDNIIASVHESCNKLNLKTEEVFRSVKIFSDTKKYNKQEFDTFVSGKWFSPYELAIDFQSMEEWTHIPSKTDFKSILRDSDGLSEEEYDQFKAIWNQMEIENLFHFFSLYLLR